MELIYHITTANQWEQALQKGIFSAPSLEKEGFIHCCDKHQIENIIQRYFSKEANRLLLTINCSLLKSKVVREFSPSVQEEFAHVYGAIPLEAITNVSSI